MFDRNICLNGNSSSIPVSKLNEAYDSKLEGVHSELV